MKISPTLSIIIPTYNSEKTIERCIDSIIQQNFKNYEVLIIDNLSTDKTLSIVDAYKLKKIKIFTDKDHGIYDAMNKGIKLAEGEWIYFLGSDDYLLSSVVLSSIFNFDSIDNFEAIYGNVESDIFDNLVYDYEFNGEKLYHKNICHQAIFIRKNVFIKIGNFNLNYPILADWDHNFRWFLNPQIKKTFLNINIAYFSAGGISGSGNDSNFRLDKSWNFIKYNKKNLRIKEKIILIKRELLFSIKNQHKTRVLKILLEIPSVIFG